MSGIINPVPTTKHYKRFPPFSLIEEIRRKVASDEFEFSKHAVDQSILRQIRIHEIKEAIANSQVIEDYPNDGIQAVSSVVDAGCTTNPCQCSYPSRPLIKIITVYEPDPKRWNDDFTKRRSSDDDE